MSLPGTKAQPLAADSPLTGYQLMVVLLCVFINICDGLDTTATSFAAPVLIKDWNLPAATMGLILSVGSAGLMAGALLVSPQADRFGRRPLIIVATLVSALAMFGMAFSNSLEMLMIFRFISGLAVGSLLPSLSVMVIEYSNEARGNIFLAIVHIGFAIGAMLGGALGSALLGDYGWRAIFLSAGCLTAVAGLLSAILLPESLHFLVTRQPRNALERANRLLTRLKVQTLEALPEKVEIKRNAPIAVGALLTKALIAATLFLWVAAFLRYFVSYFLTSWKPQLFVLSGFTPSQAATVGIFTSFAAAIGVLTMGFAATRLGAPRAAAITFAMCSVSLFGFGLFDAPAALIAFAILAMLSVEAAFSGVMITAARLYPDEIRATGVGFAVGIGRVGAIAGPYFGGVVIGMGLDRSSFMPIYAIAALLGGIAILSVGAHAQFRRRRTVRETGE